MGVQKVYSEEEKQRKFVDKTKIHYVMLVIFILATIAVIVGLVYISKSRDNGAAEEIKTTTTPSATSPKTTPGDSVLARLTDRLQGEPGVTFSNFTNFDGTVERNVFYTEPKNAAQVQRIIRAARELGLKVGSAGGINSYSDLFPEEDQILIKASSIKTREGGPAMVVEDTQGSGKTLTAAAGFTQGDLLEFMVENSVQIPVLGALKQITLAGGISTATHQDSIRRGSISDYVVGVRLVDAQGDVRSYNMADNPDVMKSLRACIGMCGVITEITYQVEPISTVVESHTWETAESSILNATFLSEVTGVGALHAFWAPLSVLTPGEWDTYQETGEIPADYNPTQDMVWIKRMVQRTEDDTEVVCQAELQAGRRRRRRRASRPVPGLDGNLLMVDGQEEHEKIVRRSKRDNHGDLRPLNNHKIRYNMARMYFNGSSTRCQPLAQSYVDISLQEKLFEVEFIFADKADFFVSINAVEIVLAELKKKAEGSPPRMPIIVLELRWNAKSTDCLLCPGNLDDGDHVFTMSLVADPTKTEYKDYMIEMFPILKAAYPVVRVHWAKFYDYLPEIHEHLGQVYEENIRLFNQVRSNNDLKGDDIFLTKNLAEIFM